MRRAGKIGLVASAVLATGVVTGGMLAIGQELTVDDNPGEPLTLEGVETGVAAEDASASGARIRAEGTTPKVEPVVEQPVVDEVPPADPVVITPRRPAPAPAAPPPPAPAPEPKDKKDDHKGDDGPKWDWDDGRDGGDGDRDSGDGDRDGGGDWGHR
jgi:outer membrane biosynthesis protein TonB